MLNKKSKKNNNIYIHKTVKIGKNVVINPNVVIGDNCEISSFVSIGSPAEMPKEKTMNFSVTIEDNVRIREFVTIHSGHTRNTEIQEGVYIMNQSYIAHDCILKKNSIISANVTLAGHVEIGEEAFLGIASAVHQRSKVGDLTILGANSFAKGVLGPCLKYVGNPAVAISINDHAINNTKKEGKEVDSYIISAKKILNSSAKVNSEDYLKEEIFKELKNEKK